MPALRQIAVVLEEFKLGSPGQQLLDRFLFGFPHQGTFKTFDQVRIVAHLGGPDDGGYARRVKDHRLTATATASEAVASADAVILVGPGTGLTARSPSLQDSLRAAPAGARFFVYGGLAPTLAEARTHLALAESKQIQLLAGTTLPHTPRLPEVDLPVGTRARDGLIVVPASGPEAALLGFDGLFPLVERRSGGEAGVKRIRFLEGEDVWRAGQERLWSWALLAAAISRSDSPLGDPVKDGRTQDIVGLGLLPTLVPSPQAWLLEHRDGYQSAVLALSGAVADVNVAVRTTAGRVISAQLYRPPPPQEHHYSSLAAILAEYFQSGTPPWPEKRGLLLAALMEKVQAKGGAPTPVDRISYRLAG